MEHSSIAEAAVVAIPHEVKGQALVAYVTPINGVVASDQLIKELKESVKKGIGSFASPEMIVVIFHP